MDKNKLKGLYGPFIITVAGIVSPLAASLLSQDHWKLVVQLLPLVGALLYLAFAQSKTDDKLNDFMFKTDATLVQFTQRTQDTLDRFAAQTALKVDEFVASRPPGEIRVTTTPLKDMERKLLAAKHRIDLMYLSTDPKLDGPSKAYWENTTKAYLASAKHNPIPIRRIATISNPGKLRFLLRNNEFYLKAGPALESVDYRLLYLPHHELRPTQVDIIDGEAFLFSPYGGNTLILNNSAMVKQYAEHFAELVNHLTKEGTLLSTNSRRPPDGRLECCYNTEELTSIARVMRDLPNFDSITDFRSLLEPYFPSTWSWQKFEQTYEGLKH